MYRLLFADDESIVREGVSTKVSWGDLGFELAGVLSNGREVLEYLEDSAVDVILLDISMPLLDGLGVCREVSQRFPDIVLMLLTGYDEFEYAQEALKYNVREFLLKPITAAELEDVLSGVRQELDKRAQMRSDEAALRARLEESIPLLRERFLRRLILGLLSEEAIERRGADLQWEDLHSWYQVAVVNVPSRWEELDRLTLIERTSELLLEEDELIVDSEENLVLLLQATEQHELENRTAKISRKVMRSSNREGKPGIGVAIGETVSHAERVNHSYETAQRALRHMRLLGLPQVISAGDLSALHALPVANHHELARALVSDLRRGDRDRAMATLSRLFTELGAHYVEPGAADAYLARIQFLLLDFVEELGYGPTDVPDTISSLFYPQHFPSLADANQYFNCNLVSIMDYLLLKKKHAIDSRMDRAIEIIRNRYTECDLSLQDVCDEVYLSVSQFSVLFKEATGQTFVEFLTQCRVEKAKELLKTTSMRTYEIAEEVGYADPRYFSYVLKKNTGKTSSQIREGA